jgi:hypothetical protein
VKSLLAGSSFTLLIRTTSFGHGSTPQEPLIRLCSGFVGLAKVSLPQTEADTLVGGTCRAESTERAGIERGGKLPILVRELSVHVFQEKEVSGHWFDSARKEEKR